jgi:hypothetical protein
MRPEVFCSTSTIGSTGYLCDFSRVRPSSVTCEHGELSGHLRNSTSASVSLSVVIHAPPSAIGLKTPQVAQGTCLTCSLERQTPTLCNYRGLCMVIMLTGIRWSCAILCGMPLGGVI